MSAPASSKVAISTHDPNSFANNRHARVTHSHLNIAVNFNESVLRGSVEHSVELLQPTGELVLDTDGKLKVSKVELVSGGALSFAFGASDSTFGVPLVVSLPADAQAAGSKLVVRVSYETSPDAGAIQWLPKEQTKGGKHPYLFTQCQAIHARSLLPCQDTPSNKFTYSARVEVDAPLRALMSAQSSEEVAETKGAARVQYDFKQPEPIPSYLLALAVGALESRRVGPRSHVWSEAEMVEAGAFEFAKTEEFIKAGEDVCGPYPWGIYDILLLPPSFPYGGMENPCLTFVTPTLLAGDRSLANVVAHEIAHSWFGNFVTSETWESFWMNEGFTVFLERKIVKALQGKAHQDLHAQIGLNDLEKSIDRFGADHPFTCLCPRLQGVDPDDAFSSVPYEKGFNFLTYLENLVGGEEVMNPFLRAHCQRFAHSTVNSEQWKPFFLDYMLNVAKVPQDKLNQIDWDTWYHKPGMPVVSNQFDQSLIQGSNDLANLLLAGGEAAGKVGKDALASWDSAQIVIFLERLISAQKDANASGDAEKQAALRERLQAIDALFNFTASRNSELRFRWLTLAIRAVPALEDRYPAVEAFLREQGRMKYIRPLFRDLYESDGKGRTFGVELFKTIGKQYHSIAQKMVARDLHLDE